MNKDAWKTIKSFGSEEAVRMRHCRGCLYLGTVGCNGCCNYWEITDRRRGSAFGGKDCPQKILIPGYVIPQDHIEFCERKDREEQKRAELEEQRKRDLNEYLARINSPDAERIDGRKNNGRQIDWDVEYAHILYNAGYFSFEIAEIVGVERRTLNLYIRNHFWSAELPPYLVRSYHDIDKAKAEYAEYKRRTANITGKEKHDGI